MAVVESSIGPTRKRAQVATRRAVGSSRNGSRTASGAMTTKALMALIAAVLTPGANHLKHQLALALEVSGESDAIAAGPLHPESSDFAEPLRPSQQSRVAASCGRDLEVTEVAAEAVFGVPDVAVLVGVDADDDADWDVCVCDAGYCHRPSSAGLIGGRLPGGRTALRSGLCQPPIKSLLAR